MISDLMDITLIEQSGLQLVKTRFGVKELAGYCSKQLEMDMRGRRILASQAPNILRISVCDR